MVVMIAAKELEETTTKTMEETDPSYGTQYTLLRNLHLKGTESLILLANRHACTVEQWVTELS